MNTTKNKLFLSLLLLGISFNLFAQHGIGTNEPNLNAALDLTASDKGLLVPRLELNDAAVFFPGVTATASDTSLLVFNTNTISTTASGLQGTGFYFWNGTYWERFTTSTENKLITSLDCHAATFSGTVITGEAANLSVTIPYSGGNGSSYAGGAVVQSGVELGMSGLTATLQAGTLANGTGSLTYSITGTPATSGNAYFGIEFNGQNCVLVVPVNDSSSGGTAVVSNWDCSGTATGTLYRGQAADGVTKIIYADVTKAGTYKLSMTSNGITYSSEGSFAGAGSNIAVTLTANGTPAASGTSSFTLETTPNCSFEVEVLDRSSGGTATVSSYDCNGTATGSLTIATAIAEGSVTQQITAEVTTGGTYDITTTANGVTFTASGTFAGTGSQPITLTATGTPTAMGTHAFTLSTTPNCSFERETTAQDSSGGSAVVSNWTCDGADAGTLTKGMAVVGVTKIITATVSEVGTYNITAYSSGVTYTGMGAFTVTGAQSVLLTASGTPTESGLTTYTLSTTPNCEFTRTVIDLTTGGTASVDNWDCAAGTSSGTLYRNEDTTGDGIYKTIEGNVTQLGSYNFTATANGVTYTASGTFTTLGSQTVTLTATGTPADTGTHAYALSTTPSCSFDLTTLDRSSGGTAILAFNCGVTAETGTVTATEAVVGVTQEIQATVTKAGTYSITTDEVNGITFANSGSLITGTQSITLTGTGTATAGGTSTYTLDTTPSCTFTREAFVGEPTISDFAILGARANDNSGWSVSDAGDVNGDGIPDVIVGAPFADPGGRSSAGAAWVVFGTGTTSAVDALDVETNTGGLGFTINGARAFDTAGTSVSGIGDVNGDGFDDVIVGANGVNTAYVVFGKATTTPIELANIETNTGGLGYAINQASTGDQLGDGVSGAGDVNGDGIPDVIVGAPFADPGGRADAGTAYVVFGRSATTAIELSNIETNTGGLGFAINGATAVDLAGYSVSGAGDVNGDGFDDVIVGGRDADPGGRVDAGTVYVVFGKATTTAIELSNIETNTGGLGFAINAASSNDRAGFSVSGAGDVNGDGIPDVILGALNADLPGRTAAGAAYVVFGKTANTTPIDISDIDNDTGGHGYAIYGATSGDVIGQTVSGAGDVNGDGFDDVIVGSFYCDPGGILDAGTAYVVFGKTADTVPIDLLDVENDTGAHGYAINGLQVNDKNGYSVSGAGDMNGDGYDDVIVGAYAADPLGRAGAGEAHIVTGRTATTPITLTDY